METTLPTPRVAILPTPGMGHLIPLAEFAKRLLIHHNISVTFIIPSDGSHMKPQKNILETLPKTINAIFLPPVSFDDLPKDSKIETRIIISVTRSLPALRQTLKQLRDSTRLLALVVDLFGTVAFDVATELRIPPYIFYPSTALALLLIFHMPKLDQSCTCEYRDLPEPVTLPGCVPLQGRDLPDPVQDRKDDAYTRVLNLCKRYNMAEGIIVNSYMDLEPGAFNALKEGGLRKPPVYPVGPLVRSGSTNLVDGSMCLKWLDEQPRGSVLFISFGSGGTLSHEQLTELALGLELSGQRFLWSVKRPEKSVNANYFQVEGTKDHPFDFLPEGFLDRTKAVGLVVQSWVPQVEILSHGSTGGFLSHCGWNSTLESIVNGVPLIAWPLFAEQRMNAVLLADDWKVALRVKLNKNNIVERADIATNVKRLIQGEERKDILSKIKTFKDAASRVLSQDGSSTRSLSQMVQKWMNHKTE